MTDAGQRAAGSASGSAALAGGARIVQYRNKSADASFAPPTGGIAAAAVPERMPLPLIVNDDVSLAAGDRRRRRASGARRRRRERCTQPARARKRVIGVSCYDRLTRALAAQDEGADYVAFGSFFPSAVKPHAARASLQLLRQARDAHTVADRRHRRHNDAQCGATARSGSRCAGGHLGAVRCRRYTTSCAKLRALICKPRNPHPETP